MGAPTFSPVILSHQKKSDGSYNVKIRITHKRKIKYLPTDEFARKGDFDKDLRITKTSLLKRLYDLIEKMEIAMKKGNTLFDIDAMDVHEIAATIERNMRREEEFRLDFFEHGEKFAASHPKYSASNYRTALRAFSSFMGTSSMDISMITSSLMRRYEEFLISKHGKDARAVSLYLSAIAAIHSNARKMYNDNETGSVRIRNPFEFYTPPKQVPAVKKSLSMETMQKLIDVRPQIKDELTLLAVDVFLLSFTLMGTNIPDLFYATMYDDDTILYYRTKTKDRRHDKAEMRIRLEKSVSKLYERYADPMKERAFNLCRRYATYRSIPDKGNDRLKRVAEMIGEEPFTFKDARHTWATIAYNHAGIPIDVVNDSLCHVETSLTVTNIYIEKDWSIRWDANRKVLDLFDWHNL